MHTKHKIQRERERDLVQGSCSRDPGVLRYFVEEIPICTPKPICVPWLRHESYTTTCTDPNRLIHAHKLHIHVHIQMHANVLYTCVTKLLLGYGRFLEIHRCQRPTQGNADNRRNTNNQYSKTTKAARTLRSMFFLQIESSR